jgi:hypothetical protein
MGTAKRTWQGTAARIVVPRQNSIHAEKWRDSPPSQREKSELDQELL